MRLTKVTSALTILFVSLFFIACDDDSTEFGATMMPDSDKFSGFENDTIIVTASQYNYDEYASQSDLVYLGIATDPVFGEISASLFNELVLEVNAANCDGLTKVLDSVKLHLYFDRTSIYKSPDVSVENNSLRLAIYSMTDSLCLDSFYRNSLDAERFYDPSSLLISTDFEVQNKFVTIDFPGSSFNYFQKIVDLDSAALHYRDSLLTAGVYGLFLKPLAVSGNGIIGRLNTGEYDSTYLDIYYHVKDDTLAHYLKMSFISNWYDTADYSIIYGNAKTNPIKYDYSKASVNSALKGLVDDSLFYIIGEGGQKAKLNFSDLALLPDLGKYNVLKAELFVPYDLVKRNLTKLATTNFDLYFLPKADSFIRYSDYFAHTRYKPHIDTTTDSYLFDMTEYVQQKLKYPSFSDELYLLNSASFSSTILKKNRIKLKIKYTKL